jgi:PRC-barrel domain
METSTLRRLQDAGETVADPDEDARGRKVLDSARNKMGTVDGLMVDDAQDKVRFLRVEWGRFLGLAATHVMIPVDAGSSITGEAVTIDRAGAHLHKAPRYVRHSSRSRMSSIGVASTATTASRRPGGWRTCTRRTRTTAPARQPPAAAPGQPAPTRNTALDIDDPRER